MPESLNKKVFDWTSDVRQVRDDLDLFVLDYPDWLVLSFINYESGGDASFSQGNRRGLLGITESDAQKTGTSFSEIQGSGPGDKKAGQASIRHFFRYMVKYREFTSDITGGRLVGHYGDFGRMAIAWNGGLKVLSDYAHAVREGGRSSGEKVLVEADAVAHRDAMLQLMADVRNFAGSTASEVRTTPSGRRVNAGVSAANPKCRSAVARRKRGPSESTKKRTQSARTSARESGAKSYFLVIKEYAENEPIAAQGPTVAAAIRATAGGRTVAFEGYLGGSRDYNAFAFTVRMPDVSKLFVQPIEHADRYRDAFGVRKENVRFHLGVDYETRSVAQVQAGAVTNPAAGVTGRVPCYAVTDGEVITAGRLGAYGKVIYLAHEGGVTSRYAHLHQIGVGVGEFVKKGQKIGVCGTTGESDDTGAFSETAFSIPHLHFEIRINRGVIASAGRNQSSLHANSENIAINPLAWLSRAPGPLDVVKAEPELVKAWRDLADTYRTLSTEALTDLARAQSQRAFETATAQQRAHEIADMDRKKYYDAELAAVPVYQRKVEYDLSPSEDVYSTYPRQEQVTTGAVGDGEVEAETSLTVNDSGDTALILAAMRKRLREVSARVDNFGAVAPGVLDVQADNLVTVINAVKSGEAAVETTIVSTDDGETKKIEAVASGVLVSLLVYDDSRRELFIQA